MKEIICRKDRIENFRKGSFLVFDLSKVNLINHSFKEDKRKSRYHIFFSCFCIINFGIERAIKDSNRTIGRYPLRKIGV